jgi:hypothetical protein
MLATVMDHQPMTTITPFGVCISLGNPAVASATAAAGGALQAMPCTPQTPSPWVPGALYIHQVQSSGARHAALTSDSTCNCVYGGLIQITNPACKLRAQ